MVVYTKRKHPIFTYFFSPISFNINAIIQAAPERYTRPATQSLHYTPLKFIVLLCSRRRWRWHTNTHTQESPMSRVCARESTKAIPNIRCHNKNNILPGINNFMAHALLLVVRVSSSRRCKASDWRRGLLLPAPKIRQIEKKESFILYYALLFYTTLSYR